MGLNYGANKYPGPEDKHPLPTRKGRAIALLVALIGGALLYHIIGTSEPRRTIVAALLIFSPALYEIYLGWSRRKAVSPSDKSKEKA